MSDSESVTSNPDTNDLSNPDIVTKYRMAGDFANAALKEVVAACKAGAKVLELCELGDASIVKHTATVFNKPQIVNGEKVKIERGIAFPTSVSVNHVLGNFCPRDTDAAVEIADGDVVKIELGVHIDGYVAGVTHTVVVGGKPSVARGGDAVAAAHTALEATLRCLRPGTKSTEIEKVVTAVGEAYGVKPIENVKCTSMKRFVVEASKQVPIKSRPEEKVEEFEMEENDVFSMEISYTTGEDGKCSDKDGVVSVFRRAVDVTYMLKLKAARQLFSEINTVAPTLPFSIRAMEKKLGTPARLGLKELLEHDLLLPYPVLSDKPGEAVATFKCTCLVLPSGVCKLTGADYPEGLSDKKVEDENVKRLLAMGLKINKKKKKKAAK